MDGAVLAYGDEEDVDLLTLEVDGAEMQHDFASPVSIGF
jgi:uncharacterized ParB-like nuclease family protein